MSKNYNLLSTKQWLEEVSGSELYPQFLMQLQKDINRAGIDYVLESKEPWEVFVELENLISNKLQDSGGFHEYVNLLYAVDVSETKIRNLDSEDSFDISKYATYLILKREWQKVGFRNSY
ncbi:hypothetical protein [Aquimarina pacifica]|uniref:hypothetical protein n=1 Tax=Aquimarina pacifica TaxID=1296415 RepID=UPI0004722110|nr:hypothetical protein [Aquimarina pacifica]